MYHTTHKNTICNNQWRLVTGYSTPPRKWRK